jgi:hypothetical protein
MFAQALLALTIPLLPVSEAIDAQDPGGPLQPTQEEAPEAPRPMIPGAAPSAVERDRRSAVYLVGGFATPLGFLGIEGVRRLGPIFTPQATLTELEITGGLGIGYDAAQAEPHAGVGRWLQWAVMPRLRFGDSGGAFTIGAGVSGGNFTIRPVSFVDVPPPAPPLSYYLWSNFEIGGEWWWSGGFALRFFGGYEHAWCVSGTCYSPQHDLPYTGLGLGYAL